MNWFELVIFGIFVVMTVGGWVVGAIQKSEQRRKSHVPDYTPRPDHAPSSQLPRANELAAQRREKLAQLAAERRRSKGLSPVGKKAGPQNLSVAERGERQKAIEQYQKRAEQLRAQQLQRAQQRAPQRAPVAPSRPTKAVASRQASRGPAPSHPKPAGRGGQLSQRHMTTKIAGRDQALGSVKERHIQPKTARLSEQVVDDFDAPKPARGAVQGIAKPSAALTAGGVRQAIIAMELLGRPVALREASEQPGNFTG